MGIAWTDATWNPMTGCTKISAGCDHCYAELVAWRKTKTLYLAHPPVRDTPTHRDNPFAPRFWANRLELPLRWRRPRRIFVNSMSDVFHADFSLEMIAAVFDIIVRARHHQFQVLTKRPERALRFAADLPWPENLWLGTTVETMDVAHRIAALRQIPAAVKFISAEPLLGPLDALNLSGVDWVIGGGESGAGARPCDPAWARGLLAASRRYGAAFFWKQWGGLTPNARGRLLDGVPYAEFPRELDEPPETPARRRAGRG